MERYMEEMERHRPVYDVVAVTAAADDELTISVVDDRDGDAARRYRVEEDDGWTMTRDGYPTYALPFDLSDRPVDVADAELLVAVYDRLAADGRDAWPPDEAF